MNKFFLKAVFLAFFMQNLAFGLTTAESSAITKRLSSFLAPYGSKVGVSFIEIKTGTKLSVNGKKKYMAASVIKVPVMATAYNLNEKGKMSLDDKILFTENLKLPGSGVLQWMKGSRYYTIRNLVRLMIVLSDNTATRMVINKVGTQEINSYMEYLGLKNTKITDTTCLNEPPQKFINYTTPDDMAYLLLIMKESKNFTAESKVEMINFMKRQKYRWGIWRGVPSGIVVADKTGNVEGVLNDIGIVYAPKGPYILSIFTNGFKKQKDARLAINGVSKIFFEETNYKIKSEIKQKKKKPIRKKRIIPRKQKKSARKTIKKK